MTDPVVLWLDGELVDPAAAAVAWNDHGLTVGDGVFETIELRGGAAFALTRQSARSRYSLIELATSTSVRRSSRRRRCWSR